MFIYIRGCMNQRSCDYATLSFDLIISTTFFNFTKVFTKNSDLPSEEVLLHRGSKFFSLHTRSALQ